MKISSECIQCVVGSAIELLNQQLPAECHESVTRRMLEIASRQDWADTPPEFAQKLYGCLREAGGVPDSFRAAKDHSTRLALELLPEMREFIAAAPDSFGAVVKAVIGGNIIDCGADRTIDIGRAVPKLREVFNMPLDNAKIRAFEKIFEHAESLFYVLDNCGEAVFDRLLLERFPGRVTLGVRGDFILNDVTRREIPPSGLAHYPVVDTGMPTPGVPLKYARRDFLDAMRAADLVISKGQGNFETLGDYERPIAYLLRVKCPVVARDLQMPLGALELVLRNCR